MFRRNRKRKRVKYGLLILLSALLLLGISRLGVFNPFKSVVEKKVIIPYRSQRYNRNNTGVDVDKLILNSIKDASGLKITQLSEENLQLKKMLAVSLPKEWKYIQAPVIEFNNDKIVIARGANQGVSLGMIAVIAEDRPVLVGKVSKLSTDQAVISLPSEYDRQLSVILVNHEGGDSKMGNILGRGLTVGQGDSKLIVSQILNQEIVGEGDLVGYYYDDNLLLIGRVSEINTDSSGIFQSAKINPAIVPYKLLNVFLVIN